MSHDSFKRLPNRPTDKRYLFEVHTQNPAHGEMFAVWADSMFDAVAELKERLGPVDWQWAYTADAAGNCEATR
jgi:hypothetical protein